ncbi:MAG TPA: endonuclease/exonuclease/phosphatase family protein [Methylophaga sp.]|nr:endonuclease/exonuclease/phosphatase family protein [Methylophaga sp.]
MNTIGKVFYLLCRFLLSLLALALIYATAVPLLHSDIWWIRIFDFPRVQIATLIALTLVGYLALYYWRRLHLWEYVVVALVGVSLVWQLIAIAPYTVFYPKEMADSQHDNDANRISLLIYNLRYDNREVEALRDLIRKKDPDLILLSETTPWWFEQLQDLEQEYPYKIEQPQRNHYGMLLYSRLALVNPQIRFLVEPEIPSFRTQVRLRSADLVTFYGVHPRPPGLKLPEDEVEEDGEERADADMRDAELMMVAKEVKKLGDVPVIVAGDFNDVAWSHTTHLFQRIGGLLDPRVGRGLLNTFDTRSRLFRYPLGHAFASQHFFLVELERLPDIGSDHFPLFVVFDLDPSASLINEEPQQSAGDEQEADKATKKGKSID